MASLLKQSYDFYHDSPFYNVGKVEYIDINFFFFALVSTSVILAIYILLLLSGNHEKKELRPSCRGEICQHWPSFLRHLANHAVMHRKTERARRQLLQSSKAPGSYSSQHGFSFASTTG